MKPPGLLEFPVGVKGDLTVETDVAVGDVIEFKRFGGHAFQTFDVELVFDGRNLDSHHARADFQQIRALGQQHILVHPDQVTGKLVAPAGRIGGRSNDVATAHVEFVGQRERHGLAGSRTREVAVRGHDATHGRGLVRGTDQDGVTGTHETRGDGAREPAEAAIGVVDPLHGHAKRFALAVGRHVDGFKSMEERRPVIPVHRNGRLDHIVTGQGRNRNAGDVSEIESLRIVTIDSHNPVIDGPGPRREIHLVDRQDHVTDAQEGEDRGVAAGLRHDALTGVDEDDGEIGGPCARRHVARVLLAPRCVGDNKRTFVCRERAVGDIRRNPPFAFRLEMVKQAADQCGLAVASTAADDEAQGVLPGIVRLRLKRVETAEASLIRHGPLF